MFDYTAKVRRMFDNGKHFSLKCAYKDGNCWEKRNSCPRNGSC